MEGRGKEEEGGTNVALDSICSNGRRLNVITYSHWALLKMLFRGSRDL